MGNLARSICAYLRMRYLTLVNWDLLGTNFLFEGSLEYMMM
jgi:hypothetical protein